MATKANPAGEGGAAVVERSDGQTDCRNTERQDDWQDQMIDPRLAFLERASARLILVEYGAMELADAFNGLVDALERMAPFVFEEGRA